MTFGRNPFNPSRSLPTLVTIQRRRRELLTTHARQKQAQATAEPGELLAEDQACLPEESLHFPQLEEAQEEHRELQHSYPPESYPDDSYPGEDSEPSLPLPPRSSTLPSPALADPALYSIAGRVVRNLTPHTEADPAARARLLLDTAPIDPTARRISQALDVTPEGLSRAQIRAPFNRHVSKERIDLALEQLMTLGLINSETSAGRGRPATLWPKSKTQKSSARRLKAHRALKAHTFPEA